VLLCQQPIDDYQKSELSGAGIFALETVDPKDLLLVEKATGAKTVGNLNELTPEDVGSAGKLRVGKIELIKTVTISGCSGATFLLRGNTMQTIEELESAIKNSILVLKLMQDDNRVLAGAGAAEIQLSQELKAYALEFSGKEQVAIQAYADALLEIPLCLASNCGLNAMDTLLELKNRHAEGQASFGVSQLGCQDWVCEEPLKVKRSILRRALEAATLMLKVDELIISKEIPKFHKQ
jgi:chaperonin GroEL (HSP60 family)